MTVVNDAHPCNSGDELSASAAYEDMAKRGRSAIAAVTPELFYRAIAIDCPGAVQGLVFTGRDQAPNDHLYNKRGAPFGLWAAEHVNERSGAYMTMAAYKQDGVGRWSGRAKQNIMAVGGFWLDIEGSPEKYAKPSGPDQGYADARAAMAAVVAFIKASAPLIPNFLVQTGSGGIHLHYVLSAPVALSEWLPRAAWFIAWVQKQRLKVDAQCTTDAARIMRAPGSIHQKTGVVVTAHRVREEPYRLGVLDVLMGYEELGATALQLPGGKKYDLSIQGDVIGDYPKFSYLKAAEKCGAMRKAAERHGQETPYPVWILAARAAYLSVEGRDLAHSISEGHPDYDEAQTDKKLGSLSGGPAGCDAWAAAWGSGGPCDSCEFRGVRHD